MILKEDDCGLVHSQAAANGAVIRNIAFNLSVMSGYQSLSEAIGATGEKISALWNVLMAMRA